MIELKGMTWDHSRGYTPLVACSQRYAELNPGISISWQKRSLQAFADYPIEKLAKDFDLLIIDHPWVGTASERNEVLPLDKWLSPNYLADQNANSVGFSHASYSCHGHQWALAIDAATPVACYRADLMQTLDFALPTDWKTLLELGQKGKLAIPGVPIDLLMCFYQFCIASGETPFLSLHEVVNKEIGFRALQLMKEIWSLVDPACFTANPIRIAEWMSSTNEFVYCPFAYGYSNYSRSGYAKYRLTYTNVISLVAGEPILRTTLGGTGIAVSASSTYPEQAVEFVGWIMSEEIQVGLYGENGGQPGHLKAWQSTQLNQLTNHYFTNTLETMQRAYMRPRYHGYLKFQDHAGLLIQDFLKGNVSAISTLDNLNQCYKTSTYGIRHLGYAFACVGFDESKI